jgi:hypothetical protein
LSSYRVIWKRLFSNLMALSSSFLDRESFSTKAVPQYYHGRIPKCPESTIPWEMLSKKIVFVLNDAGNAKTRLKVVRELRNCDSNDALNLCNQLFPLVSGLMFSELKLLVVHGTQCCSRGANDGPITTAGRSAWSHQSFSI